MTGRTTPALRWMLGGVFLAGLALQLWMWSRQAPGSDQAALLEVGRSLLAGDGLQPVGKAMSGEGTIPGALLELLVGTPLLLWNDPRAPALLVVLFHLGAFVLLADAIRRVAAPPVAFLFLTLWWLSPWRLFHGAFLWEPNYLALPFAAHLWACVRLQPPVPVGASGSGGVGGGGSSAPSPPGVRRVAGAVLGLTLVATLQIHASAVLLWLLTVGLVFGRRIRPRAGDWASVGVGAGIGALTLLPTAAAALVGRLPAIAPGGSGVFDRVVQGLANLPKAFLYFLRMGSADLGRRIRETGEAVSGSATSAAWAPMPEAVIAVANGLAVATIVLAAVAGWWFWRRAGEVREAGCSDWLRGYTGWAFLALLAGAILNPVTVQSWHGVVLLGACLVPLASFLATGPGSALRRDASAGRTSGLRRGPSVRRLLLAVWLTVGLGVALLVGAAHPWFRGGLAAGGELGAVGSGSAGAFRAGSVVTVFDTLEADAHGVRTVEVLNEGYDPGAGPACRLEERLRIGSLEGPEDAFGSATAYLSGGVRRYHSGCSSFFRAASSWRWWSSRSCLGGGPRSLCSGWCPSPGRGWVPPPPGRPCSSRSIGRGRRGRVDGGHAEKEVKVLPPD